MSGRAVFADVDQNISAIDISALSSLLDA